MAGIQPFLAANHSFCAMAARFVRAMARLLVQCESDHDGASSTSRV